MNIAFFTEAYNPYQSGVTISIDTFARDLVRLGHKVRVYAPGYPGYVDSCTNPSSYRFFSVPVVYPGFRLAIPNYLALAKDIRKFKPDIIHAHHPYQLGLLARYWARKLNLPLFYTFHTLFTKYLDLVPLVNKRWLQKIVTTVVRNYCDACTAVIVPTEQAAKHLADIYHIYSRIVVIPTGIDLTKFPLQPARKNPVHRKIIHVGRLSPEKNIGFLFQVLNKLPEDISLIIVGDGPHRQVLEAQVSSLGLNSRVSFAGFKAREQLSDFFSQADIFVTASKSETQGLVFMEAKVAGLPTVAIKAEGALDMVVDSEEGYLVEDDVDSFAKQIMNLYDNDSPYFSFSKSALQNIEAFSSLQMAERLQDIYNNNFL